jgi:translation initiation factor IF-2
MAEAGSKKIKVYNLAKELNLSSETLIEFLKKKGFEAKTHMSVVDEDMISVVHAHFKKDKDVADRHHRKMQEFRSTRKKEEPEKPLQEEKEDRKS